MRIQKKKKKKPFMEKFSPLCLLHLFCSNTACLCGPGLFGKGLWGYAKGLGLAGPSRVQHDEHLGCVTSPES